MGRVVLHGGSRLSAEDFEQWEAIALWCGVWGPSRFHPTPSNRALSVGAHFNESHYGETDDQTLFRRICVLLFVFVLPDGDSDLSECLLS